LYHWGRRVGRQREGLKLNTSQGSNQKKKKTKKTPSRPHRKGEVNIEMTRRVEGGIASL